MMDNICNIRYKDGYKTHLRSRKNQKNYKKRLTQRMKQINGCNGRVKYCDNHSSAAPKCEECYSLGSGRYYKVWYVQSDIIKTEKDHGIETLRKGNYRRNRQMIRQRTRTKLNRMSDIQMTSKIWKFL